MQDFQSLFTVCPECTDYIYVWALWAGRKGKKAVFPALRNLAWLQVKEEADGTWILKYQEL